MMLILFVCLFDKKICYYYYLHARETNKMNILIKKNVAFPIPKEFLYYLFIGIRRRRKRKEENIREFS